MVDHDMALELQIEKAFFDLAERFRASEDAEEIMQLGAQLGLLIFGAREKQARPTPAPA